MSSMKDVAKIAGVSSSTVSRVLNDSMFVTETKKKRVEEAIAIVNYKPNLIAQSLRLKTTKNIGLIFPEISDPSFQMLVKYIEESASNRGLNLIVFSTHNDYKREAHAIDMFLRQKINGIIFSRVSDESQVRNITETSDTPVVVIDRVLTDEKIPNVVLNNYRAGEIAAKHLIDCGCRKIACLTGSPKIGLVSERFRGFRDTLQLHGIPFLKNLHFEGEFTYDTGVVAIEHFLKNSFDFDGVWGQNDQIAVGAISTLLRCKIRVPEDVSVIGMDNVSFASKFFPSITTIAQPYKQMCEKAFQFIDRISSGENITHYQAVFEPFLIARESTTSVRTG